MSSTEENLMDHFKKHDYDQDLVKILEELQAMQPNENVRRADELIRNALNIATGWTEDWPPQKPLYCILEEVDRIKELTHDQH